jgi:hypothetical protein
MRSRRKLCHIGTHFSQNGSRRFLLDARNGLKQSMCLLKPYRKKRREAIWGAKRCWWYVSPTFLAASRGTL